MKIKKYIAVFSVLAAFLLPALIAHATEDTSWGKIKAQITDDAIDRTEVEAAIDFLADNRLELVNTFVEQEGITTEDGGIILDDIISRLNNFLDRHEGVVRAAKHNLQHQPGPSPKGCPNPIAIAQLPCAARNALFVGSVCELPPDLPLCAL